MSGGALARADLVTTSMAARALASVSARLRAGSRPDSPAGSGIFAHVDPFAAQQAHALTVVAEPVLTDQAERALNAAISPRRRRHRARGT